MKFFVKIPIVFGGDWLWPSRSNLTSKSSFTPFWAFQRDNSSPVQARNTKFGPEVQNTLVKTFCFEGWLSFTCQILLIFKILFICTAFASLKYLWDLHKHMKTESVPHPKWVRTNMFAPSVVSWIVEQSSCIFSVTIAGFPVLDSAIGNGFLMLLQAFAKLCIPLMPKFCMPTFGNVRNNTKTACISLYLVLFPTCICETRCYF